MDATNQFFPTEQKLTKVTRREQSRTSLENVGIHVSRYGLVATLLLIGVLKFTTGEAQGIQPLVASSPLMFWLYKVFSLQAVSNLIGVIEIAVAMLIALRHFPRGSLLWAALGPSSLSCLREFSLLDAGSVPVFTRSPLVGEVPANSSSRT